MFDDVAKYFVTTASKVVFRISVRRKLCAVKNKMPKNNNHAIKHKIQKLTPAANLLSKN
jgi:hypothetical protein